MVKVVLRGLGLLTRRQQLTLIVIAVAVLLLNLLDLFAIAALGLIVAGAAGNSEILARLPELSFDSQHFIPVAILAVSGVFIAKTLAGVWLAKKRQMFLAQLEISYSSIIANHIFSGSLSHLAVHSRASIEWSLLRSTSVAFGRVLGKAIELFSEATLSLMIIGLFFFTDWVAALGVLLYFALVVGVFQLVTHARNLLTGTEVVDGTHIVGQTITDVLTAYREIRVQSKIGFFLSRMSTARAMIANAQATQFYLQAIPRLIIEMAIILGAACFVAFQLLTSPESPDWATISIYVAGCLRLMSAILPLQRAFIQLRFDSPQASAAQDLVVEARKSDLERSVEPGDWSFQEARTSGPISVTFDRVCFSFSEGPELVSVVKEVSFHSLPGSMTAIVGASGAGKSTVLDLALGLHIATDGQVLWSGVPMREARSVYRGAANYVPQRPGLVSGTVIENIALGQSAAEVDWVRLEQALSLAHLEDFVARLPHGLETKLGKHADSFSGGEVQRIGLARALYTRPKLLVLDEATSALDGATERQIVNNLSTLRGETTILLATHRESTLRHADQVYIVSEGTISASGSPSFLRDSEPHFAKLFTRPTEG